MAFSDDLADRIRAAFDHASVSGVVEKRMFGGLAFMFRGHMTVGVVGDRLMLRLGEDGATAALTEPHTAPMDFTGKPMKTMIYVEPEGIEADDALAAWVGRAVAFARTLPAK